MKLNLLLALIALTSTGTLAYRYHSWLKWRDEWVMYWDGYFGSESTQYIPAGTTLVFGGPGQIAGWWTQRKYLGPEFDSYEGITEAEMNARRVFK